MQQVYDYLLTLEQEVKLLWLTRLTTAKVLFLVARYTPFLDQVGVVITYRESSWTVLPQRLIFHPFDRSP